LVGLTTTDDAADYKKDVIVFLTRDAIVAVIAS